MQELYSQLEVWLEKRIRKQPQAIWLVEYSNEYTKLILNSSEQLIEGQKYVFLWMIINNILPLVNCLLS